MYKRRQETTCKGDGEAIEGGWGDERRERGDGVGG